MKHMVSRMFFNLEQLVVHCFVPFLDHTEPTESVTAQNPEILTCVILPGPSAQVFHPLIAVLDPIVRRNPGHHHSGDV